MTEYRTIRLSTDEAGVTTLLMNRPDKLNSWDSEMERELDDAARAIEADLRAHRVLVIRGAGRAFCAGVDLSLVASEQRLPPRDLRTLMWARHRFFDWVEQIEIPVVAAIHGYCLGGGLELAVSCDFRLLSSDAVLSMPELGFGQVPGSGAASRITALAGPAVAKDIIMTGRRVGAEEAREIGLASRLYPAEEFDGEVATFCAELAARPPLALAMTKQVVAMVQPMEPARSRMVERLGQSALLSSADLAEGLAAAAERRKPDFRGE